jgi:uncharacterized protein
MIQRGHAVKRHQELSTWQDSKEEIWYMNILIRPLLALHLAAGGLLSLPPSASARPGSGVPALKVIAPNGAESILIGSLHIPMGVLRQPDPSVLRGAKRLVIEGSRTLGPQPPPPKLDELFGPNALESIKNGKRPPRARWAESLSDAEVDELRRNAACVTPPMSVDVLLSLRSPMMAAVLIYAPCREPNQLSRDEILNNAAAGYGVPTEILETQIVAQKRRDAVPDRLYEEALRAALGGKAQQSLHTIANAMNRGDFAAVARVVDSGYRDPTDAALFNKIMVQGRNSAWMPALRQYLDEGHAVVVVGAAHLRGAAGLVSLLEDAGYRVAPVELPPQSANGSRATN